VEEGRSAFVRNEAEKLEVTGLTPVPTTWCPPRSMWPRLRKIPAGLSTCFRHSLLTD
jgi:hypothetical protein